MASAIQALDRILQYRQQRDRADVQESLAFMQFAQQKRASEIKEFGLQLDVLEKANQQQKINTSFIQSSGLNNVLALVASSEGKDSKEIDKSIGQVADYLQEKKYGDFNKRNAQEISLALWNFKNSNDASSLLDLANKISTTVSTEPVKGEPGINDKVNLIQSFQNIGNTAQMINLGKVAKKIKKNEENLLLEKFQFAYEGDTKIQTGFGMYSPEVQKEYEAQKPVDSKVMQKADQVQSYLKMEQQREPDDEGLDIPVGDIAKGVAITGAVGGAITESQSQKFQNQFLNKVLGPLNPKTGKREFTGEIARKVKEDAKSGLSSKDFGKKYKYFDPKKGKMVPMSKSYAKSIKGQQELARQALEYAKSQTTVGKGIAKTKQAYQWAKELPSSANLKRFGGVGAFAAPIVLPSIGKAVGGDVGESVGTAASTGILTNKIVRSGKIKRSFVHHMASRFPMLAGKWGLVAMADSPAIPIADFVALGIAASDVYAEWQKWMVEE
jgi:hypothetical protein